LHVIGFELWRPTAGAIISMRRAPVRAHANLVMATIIPISTNTTIATCSQIQVGDIERQSLTL
jgi:hypothetical protein